MSKRAEEAALKAYPKEIKVAYGPLPGADGPCEFDDNLPYRIGYQVGYEQAEKDLAQDFHADTLIGDKDYEVIHTVAYGCGDEMDTTEIRVETEMFKPGQKVKVIIVDDE